MTVLQFPDRGSAGRGEDDAAAVCECGSWWFEMRPLAGEPAASFMLAEDGRVLGYSAAAHCLVCGKRQ